MQDRARIIILALFFCFTPQYLAEQNGYAIGSIFILLFSGVSDIKWWVNKAFWVVSVITSIYLGSFLLLILSTFYIFQRFGSKFSIVFLLTSLLSQVVYQQWLVNLSSNQSVFLSLSLGSAAFLVAQLFSIVFLVWMLKIYKTVALVFASTLLIWLLLSFLSFGSWLTPKVFTNDFFRFIPGLLLVILISSSLNLKGLITRNCETNLSGKRILMIFFMVFTFVYAIGLLSNRPIDKIIFDESHGAWETTKSPYGPNDFGRNITYTYSILYDYANKVFEGVSRYEGGDLPKDAAKSLFILKMPIEPLSERFQDDLAVWVESGGHLLVIADHTNLFDTTINLSPILKRLGGIELASNANFNDIGNPTIVSESRLDFFRGKILGVKSSFQYMTGASFKYIPPWALTIGDYGQSYVEDAVYFRANRFGYFSPNMNLAFGNHPSIVLLGQKNGLVTVIGDSTPWSNFAIFHGEYFDLFRSIIAVNGYSLIYQYFYISVVGLLLSLILINFFAEVGTSNVVCQLGGIVFCGAYLGVTAVIGFAGINSPVVNRDYSLSIYLGEGAKVENLSQLVPVGEHNFTRALSTFPKYGVIARLQPNSANSFNHSVPKTLFLNPKTSSLPNLYDLKKYLKTGGRMNILFDKAQVKDKDVTEWLKSLSLRLIPVKSLAIQEEGPTTIEDRVGINLTKIISYKVEALPTSHFREVGSQDFFQAFRLQGLGVEKDSMNGHLVISFNSEAISDAVMGEVWEGTIPSTLSKIREQQIAMFSTSIFPKQILAIDDQRKVYSKALNVPLKKFIVVKNGTKLMGGDIDLSQGFGSPDSLGDNPDFYLAKLESDSILFIENNCPNLDENNYCVKHFISHDLIEWVVTYSKIKDRLTAIELIHDRRFSGLNSNYNIVFLSR